MISIKELQEDLDQEQMPENENQQKTETNRPLDLNNKVVNEITDNLTNLQINNKSINNLQPFSEETQQQRKDDSSKGDHLPNTPLKQDSLPYNYKQRAKINFPEKQQQGVNNSYFNFNPQKRNSSSLTSSIFSYFDGSQKFLSEQ